MTTDQYPKDYLYKRIVQVKVFIDNNYADKIDHDKISDKAYFSKSISSASLKKSSKAN